MAFGHSRSTEAFTRDGRWPVIKAVPMTAMRVLMVSSAVLIGALTSQYARADESACEALLKKAAQELRREQYPSMLSLAMERQRQCPGADSSFLIGLAKANMLDKWLVNPAEEALEREHATIALRSALDDELRTEWRQTATVWLNYIESLPDPEAATEVAAQAVHSPLHAEPAGPPFEPTPFPWGPVVFGSIGIAMLGAALVTGVLGHDRDAEIHRVERALCYPRATPCDLHGIHAETHLQLSREQDAVQGLYTATNVLLIGGAATLLTSVVLWALRPDPDETVELSVTPYLGNGELGGLARIQF
jgi:hypothetical protein